MSTNSSRDAERLPGDAIEPISTEILLRAEELRQMREECVQQQRQQEQFEMALRFRDEELQ